MAVEKRHIDRRRSVEDAAEALGEIEGLSSFAAFSFEHPDYPFPTFVSDTDSEFPVFRAVRMGHPLIEPSGSFAIR